MRTSTERPGAVAARCANNALTASRSVKRSGAWPVARQSRAARTAGEISGEGDINGRYKMTSAHFVPALGRAILASQGIVAVGVFPQRPPHPDRCGISRSLEGGGRDYPATVLVGTRRSGSDGV